MTTWGAWWWSRWSWMSQGRLITLQLRSKARFQDKKANQRSKPPPPHTHTPTHTHPPTHIPCRSPGYRLRVRCTGLGNSSLTLPDTHHRDSHPEGSHTFGRAERNADHQRVRLKRPSRDAHHTFTTAGAPQETERRNASQQQVQNIDVVKSAWEGRQGSTQKCKNKFLPCTDGTRSEEIWMLSN